MFMDNHGIEWYIVLHWEPFGFIVNETNFDYTFEFIG